MTSLLLVVEKSQHDWKAGDKIKEEAGAALQGVPFSGMQQSPVGGLEQED